MTDRDDLNLAARLIHDALPVLTVEDSQGVYPYMMTDGKSLQVAARGSMSTNSMVCFCIAAVLGYLPDSVVAATCARIPQENHQGTKLRTCLTRALQAMVTDVVQRGGPSEEPPPEWKPSQVFRSRSRPNEGPFDSSTFGEEDPFTLTWLIEIFRLAKADSDLTDSENAAVALRIAERIATDRVKKALANPAEAVLKANTSTSERWIPHPLPLIRIVQLARLLEVGDEQEFVKVSDWFLNLLHLQLSLRGIEHGGFDPAELVFAFEGLIETAPFRVTTPMVKGFVACLEVGRKLDPTFRAQTPFKAAEAGAVHLFSSIEVFASLLRIATFRARNGDTEFFELIKPALHDYLQWLQATVVNGRARRPTGPDATSYPEDTPLDYVGWQSEFAHTGDLSAHVWLTSQVILFLSGYTVLLEASIGRAELAGVGLNAEDDRPNVDIISDASRHHLLGDDALELSDKSVYRVASRLQERFVNPRLDNRLAEASYSCLLYGPPGTGKTTLARSVAQALGWPLLTITTSDFIVDGEAQVEARAKRLFEALNAQRQMVVFFDEIDRLVLDRDTFDYKSQGDMLQFMTPSMLTKINDLRRAELVIFIVGTNYADRIDSAIKRAGRIDERLLVLPPDLSHREGIIGHELKKWDDARADDASEISQAALAAYWRTIAEIKSAVRNAVRTGGNLVEAMTSFVPAISLEARLARLNEIGSATPPSELLEEAFLLVYLLMEGREDAFFPRKYESLADRWATLEPGIIRDKEVETSLKTLFQRLR